MGRSQFPAPSMRHSFRSSATRSAGPAVRRRLAAAFARAAAFIALDRHWPSARRPQGCWCRWRIAARESPFEARYSPPGNRLRMWPPERSAEDSRRTESSKAWVEAQPGSAICRPRPTIARPLRMNRRSTVAGVVDRIRIVVIDRRGYGRTAPGGLRRWSRNRCIASCARYRPSGTGRRHWPEATSRTGSRGAGPGAPA